MKVLTLNFLTCAVKACKSTSASFPLHPKECELVSDTIELNPKLIYNVLPRVDWAALTVTAAEVTLSLPHPSPFLPSLPPE
jgi:multifunctional methyltransferase subunit TRM112